MLRSKSAEIKERDGTRISIILFTVSHVFGMEIVRLLGNSSSTKGERVENQAAREWIW